MALLTKKEIRLALSELGGWALQGKEIRRKFEFADFACAIGFVISVAIVAERANHHPDIDIRWNKITFSLSTHSEGGITGKDISLAKKIDSLLQGKQL
ncbi:MAG: 4a-hydroxytetrahydrobiopterin dehydratase [Ignavibacteriales bacterium]|nr:4a-hydroxytetrahydrobiopterin dehydratase [Ignavibacteriales bacterium]